MSQATGQDVNKVPGSINCQQMAASTKVKVSQSVEEFNFQSQQQTKVPLLNIAAIGPKLDCNQQQNGDYKLQVGVEGGGGSQQRSMGSARDSDRIISSTDNSVGSQWLSRSQGYKKNKGCQRIFRRSDDCIRGLGSGQVVVFKSEEGFPYIVKTQHDLHCDELRPRYSLELSNSREHQEQQKGLLEVVFDQEVRNQKVSFLF